ncbi:MAG: hypothetical protein ABR611_15850, partial [Chthoniobacterales bacterium]
VLSYDRNRALTEHMILQYARVWPSHPFVFHVPFQELRGEETDRVRYVQTPAAIRATVMKLIVDLARAPVAYQLNLVFDLDTRSFGDALKMPEPHQGAAVSMTADYF